jgi:6-pyruvoyltetrahydropterin/6-carboxytetrahydropterin synthase
MFEIGVVGQFEAAHRLHGDFGPAERLHGHTYRVEVAVRGPELREDGTLLDITILRGALDDVLRRLHFQNLDEVEGLAGRNTTAEAVARFLSEEISPRLALPNLESMTVRVWESPGAWAAYDSSFTTSTSPGIGS